MKFQRIKREVKIARANMQAKRQAFFLAMTRHVFSSRRRLPSLAHRV